MRPVIIMMVSAALLASAHAAAPTAPPPKPETAMEATTPALRVEANGFDASEADIRAVISSASGHLWRYFPNCRIEPIVVVHGDDGPITLFQRNAKGEIVVRLNTGTTLWCQYAYQFAHEFGHILCGYRDGPARNKWFEETLCETASLFAMRGMARTWRQTPPYPNWASYHDAIIDYTEDVETKCKGTDELLRKGMPAFYAAHKTELEADPTVRDLNRAMAVVLLRVLEQQPDNWEAVRWLNTTVAEPGDSFQTYLQKWHDAAPPARRPFIKSVAGLYGITLTDRAK